jgi:hypothetical protein
MCRYNKSEADKAHAVDSDRCTEPCQALQGFLFQANCFLLLSERPGVNIWVATEVCVVIEFGLSKVPYRSNALVMVPTHVELCIFE